MAPLPGVKVGPLDPDSTAAFGQISQKNSARKLIRLHAQAYPVALVQALALKQDEQRTLGLDIDEVRGYLDGLSLPNGDPAVPKGATVVGASVGGNRDKVQVLRYTFSVKGTGRTAKWFAPYNADVLPVSFADGAERVRVAELRDRGIVTMEGGDGGAADAKLARENDRLRRELAEAQGTPEEPADDVDQLRAELQEAREALEARDAAPAAESTASQDEPIEGYDDMNAAEVVKLVKASDTSDETRQTILNYERSHANRKGVVGAAEVALGDRGSAE